MPSIRSSANQPATLHREPKNNGRHEGSQRRGDPPPGTLVVIALVALIVGATRLGVLAGARLRGLRRLAITIAAVLQGRRKGRREREAVEGEVIRGEGERPARWAVGAAFLADARAGGRFGAP